MKKNNLKNLLGEIQLIKIQKDKYLINIFGQFEYGTKKQHTDYVALELALKRIYNNLISKGTIIYDKSIAFPWKLGCGLAGGDCSVVYPMIDKIFNEYDITIYKLKGEHKNV